MDWVTLKERGKEALKKYRYVLPVVLAGLLLMAIPDGKREEVVTEPVVEAAEQPDLQDALADILSQIRGAGKVRVLLTQRQGARTVYQTDEDLDSSGDARSDTVILTDSNRTQTGLVRQTDPPVYLGAVVVCQGADSAGVRLAIVDAVANATGLSSDKISVLKMK